jgi:hypothetical protein
MALVVTGQPFNYFVQMSAPTGEVMQMLRSIPQSGNYFDGYQVQQAMPNSVHITRNYVPMWAAIVAGTFFWCCGLGLLALYLRDTEILTLTVTATGDGGKTRLNVSGVATFAIAQAVMSAYGRFSPGEATPL